MALKAWTILFAISVANVASAQNDIRIEIDRDQDGVPEVTQSEPINSDVTINLSLVDTITTIRVYDSTRPAGFPDASVGHIQINGSLGSGGELRVLVCAPADPWPTDSRNQLFDPGVVHLGINAADGITISDAALRTRTRLAGFTSGDINGAIAVGQVQRLQCGFSPTVLNPGTIHANITAIATDAEFRTDFPPGPRPNARSIGYISAGNGITGTIKAGNTVNFDPANYATYASIEKLVVGPNSDVSGVLGIQGDILAEQGFITAVYTTGPIGATTVQPRIRAANGIREVRAITDAGTLFQRDFNLDLVSNVEYAKTGTPKNDGCLMVLETAGNITGHVHAANIALVDGPPSAAPPERVGIFAGLQSTSCAEGDILGDIDVEYIVEGKIMARTIRGAVRIGRMLEGSIVAWDVDAVSVPDSANRIPSIEVGYGDNGDGAYAYWSPGFVGTNCPDRDFRDCASLQALRGDGCDESAGTSTIAAHRIGNLKLRQVTAWESENPSTQYSHFRIPRIEVQTIESLTIGSLREGVVWSGIVNEADPSDPSSWYVSLPQATFNCIGAMGRVYGKDVTLFSVDKSMYGELRSPSLAASGTIRVGGKMGAHVDPDSSPDWQEHCECDQVTNNCTTGTYAVGAASDWPVRAHDRSEYAAIRIADPTGLHGQIILNAGASTEPVASLVRGVVALGAFDSPSQVFSMFPETSTDPRHASDSDHVLPHYKALPATFGGGAVGVVPFAVHQESSDAINGILLNTELNFVNFHQGNCGQQDAVFDYYGGVTIPQEGTPPVLLTLDGVYGVEGRAIFTAQPALPGGAPRHLAVRPTNATVGYFPAGSYVAGLAPTGRLRCAGLPASVGDVEDTPDGSFAVLLDCPASLDSCDHPGDFDCVANPAAECTCVYFFCDSIDFNNDGLFPDTLDIDDFLSVFSGGPCSNDPHCGDIDFNNDGLFPDTLDIDALLSVFSGGPCLV